MGHRGQAPSSRWQVGDGPRLFREVVRRLGAGVPLDDLGLDKVDGRVDLRRIPGRGLMLAGCHVIGVDFTGAFLADANFADVHFENCVLAKVELVSAVITGGSFVDCSFRDGDVRETSIWNATLRGLDFSVRKSSYLSVANSVFVDCKFGRLSRTEFSRSEFVDCRFLEGLSDVRFLGRPTRDDASPCYLRRVEFVSDDLTWVEFDGYEFEDVVFPSSDRLIVVPTRFAMVAERAGLLSLTRRDDIGKEFRRFLSSQTVQRPGLSDTAGWAISKRDLILSHPAGEELAEFAAEMISEAQRQLSSEGVLDASSQP